VEAAEAEAAEAEAAAAEAVAEAAVAEAEAEAEAAEAETDANIDWLADEMTALSLCDTRAAQHLFNAEHLHDRIESMLREQYMEYGFTDDDYNSMGNAKNEEDDDF
jgi:Lon protease-like protein